MEAEYEKKFKAGMNDLKTSFWKMKFNKDYLSAISNFEEAAKGFRKIKRIQRSIDSYEKCIECNKELKDHYELGSNYLAIGEMQVFDLEKVTEGIESFKEAAYHFHIAGKQQTAIKVYVDNANKLYADKQYSKAEILLKCAYDECMEHNEEEIIRVSLDEVVNNFVEVLCASEKWKESIKLLGEYIEEQKKFGEDSKYKLSKNYMRLAMLRIINGEAYLLDDITNQMWENKYDGTQEDIGDLRKLATSIEKLNKKEFNYCCNCAFTLFQSSILKGLRNLYDKREIENGPGTEGENKESTGPTTKIKDLGNLGNITEQGNIVGKPDLSSLYGNNYGNKKNNEDDDYL